MRKLVRLAAAALVAVLAAGCSRSAELQQQLDEARQKADRYEAAAEQITRLEQELAAARARLAELEQQAGEPGPAPAGWVIESVSLDAPHLDPDGLLWGQFRLKVKVRNHTGGAGAARVVGLLLVDTPNPAAYRKAGLDQVQHDGRGLELQPGEAAEVILGPYQTTHPGQSQEVVVKIIPAAGSDHVALIGPGLAETWPAWTARLPVRFPPGSD